MTSTLGQPDIVGPHGRAWAGRMTPELRAGWPAGLDTWLLHCPGAHPVWSWYVATACSLRDVPGLPPATKQQPDATHEILVLALDPDWIPGPDWCVRGEGRWAKHWLQPANLLWQAEAERDEQWCSIVRVLVEAICRGTSPEHRHCMVDLLQRELVAQRHAS